MNKIEAYFNKYCLYIFQITAFLTNRFGEGNYMRMKNSGEIPARNYGLKNSPITGYSFHGGGCGFQFRDIEVDIEFDNGEIGFTSWSFYTYVKNDIHEITEGKIDRFLNQMIKEGKLYYTGKIYKLVSTSPN